MSLLTDVIKYLIHSHSGTLALMMYCLPSTKPKPGKGAKNGKSQTDSDCFPL